MFAKEKEHRDNMPPMPNIHTHTYTKITSMTTNVMKKRVEMLMELIAKKQLKILSDTDTDIYREIEQINCHLLKKQRLT